MRINGTRAKNVSNVGSTSSVIFGVTCPTLCTQTHGELPAGGGRLTADHRAQQCRELAVEFVEFQCITTCTADLNEM